MSFYILSQHCRTNIRKYGVPPSLVCRCELLKSNQERKYDVTRMNQARRKLIVKYKKRYEEAMDYYLADYVRFGYFPSSNVAIDNLMLRIRFLQSEIVR